MELTAFGEGVSPALYERLRIAFDPSYVPPIPPVAADEPAMKPDVGNTHEPAVPPFFYNFPVAGDGVAAGLAAASVPEALVPTSPVKVGEAVVACLPAAACGVLNGGISTPSASSSNSVAKFANPGTCSTKPISERNNDSTDLHSNKERVLKRSGRQNGD